MYILSSNDLRYIIESIKKGLKETEVSLDLGLTKTRIKIDSSGFYINKKLIKIDKIRDDEKNCYIIIKNKLKKIQFFSPETKIIYKLVPTSYRPILQFSGTSMHKKEFIERIEKDRLKGKILDCGTGLGYSAITAAKTAEQVITIEKDKNVVEIAKINPYSQELFFKKNIKLIIGNISEEIKKFKDSEFDFIIFDAGTPKSSDEFFSLNNYKEAFRVLKNTVRLYHYLPKHQISIGRDFGKEIIKRIKEAGFHKTTRNIHDSYVIAEK